MGNSAISTLVENERNSWIKPHKIEYDPAQRKIQIELLEKFEKTLHLKRKSSYLYGVTYHHFWITDDTWIMEFGGGVSADLSKIEIRSARSPSDSVTEASFTMDRYYETTSCSKKTVCIAR